jgi:hypothetical protein
MILYTIDLLLFSMQASYGYGWPFAHYVYEAFQGRGTKSGRATLYLPNSYKPH